MNENEQPEIYFNEDEQLDFVEGEIIPEFEGVCPKCLGSKYKMIERNGVLGVLYTTIGEDSEGKAIKRIMGCPDCREQTTY